MKTSWCASADYLMNKYVRMAYHKDRAEFAFFIVTAIVTIYDNNRISTNAHSWFLSSLRLWVNMYEGSEPEILAQYLSGAIKYVSPTGDYSFWWALFQNKESSNSPKLDAVLNELRQNFDSRFQVPADFSKAKQYNLFLLNLLDLEAFWI